MGGKNIVCTCSALSIHTILYFVRFLLSIVGIKVCYPTKTVSCCEYGY